VVYRRKAMASLQNPRFKLAMRLLFWLALTFAVVMADLPKPPKLPIDGLGDKFEHMLAFATLAGLAALGFPSSIRWRVAERLSFLGAIIEVTQSIPALHRDCDIRDWIADTVAIIVVTAIMGLLLPQLRADTIKAG
jgi:VanZ family protein